jgi:hypothetical protein
VTIRPEQEPHPIVDMLLYMDQTIDSEKIESFISV